MFSRVAGFLPRMLLVLFAAPSFVFGQAILRLPDSVLVETSSGSNELALVRPGIWLSNDVQVTTVVSGGAIQFVLASPKTDVKHVRARWNSVWQPNWRYLGDAWEQGYGDLGWKSLDPKRSMPWCFLATDGRTTLGYGVMTGASALCSWTVSATNVVLNADVRCGGQGVILGNRVLPMCVVVSRMGRVGERPFFAAQSLCRIMCPRPRLPRSAVFGFSDILSGGGMDTVEDFKVNAAAMSLMTQNINLRPYAVVDAGWQGGAASETHGPGPWNVANSRFGSHVDIGELSVWIQRNKMRAGIWCRPTAASPNLPPQWRLARDPRALDISLPAVRAYASSVMRQFAQWGYELVKFDDSTHDIAGLWGSEMKSGFASDGWAFADRSRTTAEIIRDFYWDIRGGAGDGVVVEGCNTVGHLAAGIFEIQSAADAVGGSDRVSVFEMQVNGMAFRAPQHGVFFLVDGGCVGESLDRPVPWEMNRQWLSLLSRGGSPVFISFPKAMIKSDRLEALRWAMADAVVGQPALEPLDWMDQSMPLHWRVNGSVESFSW
jgi:alpha-galactosidase